MAITYIINGVPTKLESESGDEFVGVINGIPVVLTGQDEPVEFYKPQNRIFSGPFAGPFGGPF
jgi:hypothetical protein